jgi:hypothetical protein
MKPGNTVFWLFGCVLCLAIFLPDHGNAQHMEQGKEKPAYAVSMLGFSLGISNVHLDDLKSFMREYQANYSHVRYSNYNNLGFIVDITMKVRVHRHLSTGLQFQSLTNRMSFKYDDYSGPNPIMYFTDEETIKLKTNSILIMPVINYYLKNKGGSFRSSVMFSGGYGTARINLLNDVNGKGDGLALAGSIGMEIGGGTLKLLLDGGYRYFDPGMTYTASVAGSEDLEVDLSGFFFKVGGGIRLD